MIIIIIIILGVLERVPSKPLSHKGTPREEWILGHNNGNRPISSHKLQPITFNRGSKPVLWFLITID